MDSSNPEYAKMQARFKAENAFHDNLAPFKKKIDLHAMLLSIGVGSFKAELKIEQLKELLTENRKTQVKSLKMSLEDSICHWDLKNRRWKTQDEIEGWVVANPYVESEQRDDTPSQAASSSVGAPEDKYPQKGDEGFRYYFSDEENEEAEARKKHSELRKKHLIAKCTCCQCKKTDSNGVTDDTDGKFYCRTCPRQNYSIVLSRTPSRSPEAETGGAPAGKVSRDTTDDEEVGSSTKGNAPATDSLVNAAIKVKEEPRETSSRARAEKHTKDEKGHKPNEIVFTAFTGLFAGNAGKRSTAAAGEGPSAKAPEGPSNAKKQREIAAWLNSEKEPKKTPQKTTPAKGSEWQELQAPELRQICRLFQLTPLSSSNVSTATLDEMKDMIKKEVKALEAGFRRVNERESGSHDIARHKIAGKNGKLVLLDEYIQRCMKGGKQSQWSFEYHDKNVEQNQSDVEPVVEKEKRYNFPSNFVTAVPRSTKRQKDSDDKLESHENGAASHAYKAGAACGDKRPKWEAPISQQHSEASQSSNADDEFQDQDDASLASQSLDIGAGASPASHSLYFQQHNPSGDFNNPAGTNTLASMRRTMNWAN